jgi:hypothetical protein
MDEVETTVATQQETDTPQTSPQVDETPEPQVETKQDRNWREMRRKTSELEQKNKQQEEFIANLLKQQMAVQPQQPQHDELDAISDEDYLPKGKVKQLLKKEREDFKKDAREEAQRIINEYEKANFHKRLKDKYSDFDDVVTPETLEIIENEEPELANSIAQLKDPYLMGMQTYKYVKALGLSSKAPTQRRSKEVDKKLEQNAKTVQSPLAYEKRPVAQTFKMSEQMQKDLYKEMMEYARQAPSAAPM